MPDFKNIPWWGWVIIAIVFFVLILPIMFFIGTFIAAFGVIVVGWIILALASLHS